MADQPADLVDQQRPEGDHEHDHPDDQGREHARGGQPPALRRASWLAAGSGAKARNSEISSITSRLRSRTASQKATYRTAAPSSRSTTSRGGRPLVTTAGPGPAPPRGRGSGWSGSRSG